MSLQYTDLISNNFKSHTEKIRDNNNDETISFFIEDFKGEIHLNRYSLTGEKWIIQKNSILIDSIGHSKSSKEYIRSIFQKLDKTIDLDFIEKSNNNGSRPMSKG